jgi:CRP-like cAMP-binding protein
LSGRISIFAHLSKAERDSLLSTSEILEAPAGTAILRRGEQSDAVFFILSGQAVAGIETEQGEYRSLSTMTTGDFFGEIAALTGVARTADVVADQPTKLLRVPANTLRGLMSNPHVSKLFLSKMTERLTRTSLTELPRFGGLDQQSLRELRTPEEVSDNVENF